MSFQGLSPKIDPQLCGVTIRKMATASAPTDGHMKLRFRLSSEVLPQASNGPTAVRISNSRATGIFTRLKNGDPTVTLVPCTHSDSTLLNRKLDSRETSDSSLCSLCKCERFLT